MKGSVLQQLGNIAAAICFVAQPVGCAHAKPEEDLPVDEVLMEKVRPETATIESVEDFLSYGAWLRSIRAPSLEQEYTTAAAAQADDPSASHRIRLALLLSLPGTSFQDTARARAQLEHVLGDTDEAARPYHDLARFLKAVLDERRQVESTLTDERRQRQQLQQKLEQLKVIEQETGTRIPPKPIKEN